MGTYADIYNGWKTDPESFWMKAADAIDWVDKPTKAFFADQGVAGRWYADGSLNTCHNAVDRHVAAGRGEQTALIYDSPITGAKRSYTYAEVKTEVTALAAVLREQGVGKGDGVIIYMPMVPEAAFAMLACARIGAPHSVVFGGFAAAELATRIDDFEPKLIISASCGIEPARVVAYKPLLDGAIDLAEHKVESCVILQREKQTCDLISGRDVDYDHAVTMHRDLGTDVPCVTVKATDPLYILYTSGTTGQPKGVVRDNGGHAVALHWSMKAIYGVDPGEVYWAASDVGWVVGHSYIVYAPLLAGNTTILFEGKPVGTPDPGTFWRVMAEHKVASFFTAPTAFRAIKAQDSKGDWAQKYDLSALRTIYLAGERADPDTIHWLERVSGKPVIDHWWQTETGWTIAGNPVGIEQLPVKYGSPTVAMPGYDIRVLSDEGEDMPAGELGNVVVKLPLPPGSFPTLWKADQRFNDAYLAEFPGYYKTADAGIMDEDGYLFIMARTDDIINVAGHRLSTGGMEEVIAAHPDIAECAVIGIADEMKGQLPAGFAILNAGTDRPIPDIQKEVAALVREKIGPVAAFKILVPVARLPKTRSGKILRATMQKVVDGEEFKMPATIDDPAILEEIAASWKEHSGR
ncbi:AMP-binding protein [Ahrensia sp. R2A130]|uniref:AMP-binding protein n=1 Tax=Ahrensia sp. R2A130 TaxID=744979 RepID=UPI0001E0B528|nr:AMP-binding protein [Ahrensia sp. R2A130]EFL87788.1 acyl-CoA synthetase short-chain family member 3 [Ahrensia sp. R2A130]